MRTLSRDSLSAVQPSSTESVRSGIAARREVVFLQKVWERVQTSPGKLAVTALALSILVITAGLATFEVVTYRTHGLDTTLHREEPLSNLTLTLYTELSIADAVTGAVFLSPGLESQELRDRYDKAIASAGAITVEVAANTQRSQLQTIAEELPVYTRLVESAKVYNRADKPVGAAYLSQASHLMQTVILPAAESLHKVQIDALEDSQQSLTQPPWDLALLVLLAVGCLIGAQIRLARVSRRQFNPGLIVASGCFAVLMLWFLISFTVLVTQGNVGSNQGTVPLRTLTAARIHVQQARTQETLQLLRRGDEDQLEQGYRASIAGARRLLSQLSPTEGEVNARKTADNAAAAWEKTHGQLLKELSAGVYGESVELAIGPGPDACAAHYRAFDAAITSDIEYSRRKLRESVVRAHEALTALAPATVIITLAATAFVAAGYAPRLGEYRA